MKERFIADTMLGKLAKWLRLIGCDVEYFRLIDDRELVERALRTGRLILTRDTLLGKRRKARDNHFFVHHDNYRDQLREVIYHFGINPYENFLMRCLRCNEELVPVEKSSVEEKVPTYVYETQEEFETCPSCRGIYWGATHKDQMMRQLKDILKERSNDM